VIAQEVISGDVLMMAWMNRDALLETIRLGEAVYWTRSRQKLWHKGEESGHTQKVKEIRLDCDGDTILLMVEQKDGIACHTGEHSCFFKQWDSAKAAWVDQSSSKE
jgi:phosphoribosyl-AMP cyclohydrolase